MTENELIGFRTSFDGLFAERELPISTIRRIQIPLIQRDYAQGREDQKSTAIRGRFLDALGDALRGDSSIGLDFVYGDVRGDTFEPLDGQQRLTTLFLLHWYLSARRGSLSEARGWHRFSYATRPSARLFCERLVANPPPVDPHPTTYSDWLKDQSWYLYVWRHDPSVAAMLITIDAIHAKFQDDDIERFWSRLTDDVDPAIWFQLLPIADMGTPEDLYIKMNSRGKPLTEFEAFKASLGRLVADLGRDDFGHLIDGEWTDMLWPYRGDDNIVDDEFMHYFEFLIELCEWREGLLRAGEPTGPVARVADLLDAENPRRDEHLDFIYTAFEAWRGSVTVEDTFNALFSESVDDGKVRLFGTPPVDVNLFRACCEKYGTMRGATRVFSLTDTLLLYAVLIHRAEETSDALRRLRILRNVNEASQFELRLQNMPKLVAEVAEFMRTGDLSVLSTFNQNQVADERLKAKLKVSESELEPALNRLEDHSILRGTTASFTLDDRVGTRVKAFADAFRQDRFALLTGALLASGEYQRDFANSDCHQLGSPTSEPVWRGLLVDRGDRDALSTVRGVLESLLDRIGTSEARADETMRTVMNEFTLASEERSEYDWRYYLVRYDSMREGNSGRYYGVDQEMGFELTMLRKSVQSSYFRDAYLYAMWVEAGRPGKDLVKDPWFYGYSTKPRWMEFIRSRADMRNSSTHLLVRPPQSSFERQKKVAEVCEAAGAELVGGVWRLPIQQTTAGDRVVDVQDRVRVGAQLVTALVNSGA